MMEILKEKSDVILDPDKSYLIGEYNRIPEAKLFAQPCCLENNEYSIRVVVAKLNHHHKSWRHLCMFWELKPDLKKEDFVFKTCGLVKMKLEELCQENGWSWYY